MALYRVDFTMPLWRALFPVLYDKVVKFGLSTGNEETVLRQRFASLLLGDKSVILLVEAIPPAFSEIKSHCLLHLIPNGQGVTIVIEQWEAERDKDNTFTKECIEYMEAALPLEYPVTKAIFATTRHDYRAFQRKYGYTFVHAVLAKDIKPPTAQEGQP